MSDDEFYWDWVKHEGHIFTNRGSFFLIGESMLLAATAALLSGRIDELSSYLLIFFLAGLFITGVWLWVNIVHVCITQWSITKKLEDVEPRWKEIARRRLKRVPNHMLMGIILPGGLLIVWIILLFIYYSCAI